MDDALWGVDPASFGGEAGVGAHGAEYGAAGYLHVVDLLDDGIEHAIRILAAARGEAGGMGVAVDRGVVSQLVFPHDLAGVTPDEVIGFDFFAARVAADTALTGVAEEVWCDVDFAASDDLVDVHVSSSGARHICPTYVNGIITSCQLIKCGERSIAETTYIELRSAAEKPGVDNLEIRLPSRVRFPSKYYIWQ